MTDVYEFVAHKEFPRGVPDGCHEDWRVYEVPGLRLEMSGREWPELVVVPEWCGGGTVITHCFCTTCGFADPDGPEIARAVTVGRTARYRSCIRKALSGLGEVVVHAG